MMVIVYAVLLLFVMTLAYCKFGRIFNFVSIFTGIWCVFGVISCFGFYGLRIPDIKIHLYTLLFVGLVDFIFLTGLTHEKVSLESGNDQFVTVEYKFRIIELLAIILTIPMFIKSFNVLIDTGELEEIRRAYFSGENFKTIYEDVALRVVPISMLNVLAIFCIYHSIETKRYKFLIYTVINMGIITFVNGGRYALITLLYAIVILIICGCIDFSEIELSVAFKRRLKMVAIAVVIGMIAVTIWRNDEVLKNIVLYFSGSLSFLDYIVNNPGRFALDEPLSGYLTFGALIEPVVLTLKVLGITTADVPSYEFNIYCQYFYDIGDSNSVVQYNANTSVLYYFLRDFGVIGIVIGAVFLAILTVVAYNKWQKGSRFWGLMFIYLGVVMFNSLMTYQLFGTEPLFAAIIFYYLGNAKKKEIVKFKSKSKFEKQGSAIWKN